MLLLVLGNAHSYCVLVSDSKGEKAKERLTIMKTLYDGYSIAERDLQMRGPGDFFSSDSSIRQSGDSGLSISKSCQDMSLLHLAFESARELLLVDPDLTEEKHNDLKAKLNRALDEKSSTIN